MKKQLFILLLLVSGNVLAQRAAVKTNLLHDVATAPSLAAEWALASRWTLDVSGSACPWSFENNRKWKFWMAQGEARYWLCQSFYGHFLGVHAGGGEYNLSRVRLPFVSHSASSRYEGWAVMAGFSYGYSWVLGKRWNLEATVGAGWVHAEYKRFNCPACGEYRGADKKNFLASTRVGINLIYMLK